MRTGRSVEQPASPRIVILSGDPAFAESARTTFSLISGIDLSFVQSTPSNSEHLDIADATILIADIDDGDEIELKALASLMLRIHDRRPVVAVARHFDGALARRLMQMRVSDLLVKPIPPVELLRTCARLAETAAAGQTTDAKIFAFLPAVGGAGVTTLAVQTAMLLLNSGGVRAKVATCLVDLDFQHGACADYLDIEPRLNLGEIEPRPERLDRQLLEVMLSYHASGLAVVAAPSRPAEMRSFDPDVVTRLLDLVSAHFDYVVFDMPRTWFSWTDAVLLGSNRAFIVSETTVPSLRQARRLMEAIRERLGSEANPQVIINRFEQKLFSSGLRRADIERAIGAGVAGYVPNNYSLVREAIDRGMPLDEVKPGNKITTQLKKLVLSGQNPKTPAASARSGAAPAEAARHMPALKAKIAATL
jgi:pilus assembly protein CpaE